MPCNEHGQPIGAVLPHFTPGQHPAHMPPQPLAGRYCTVLPLHTAVCLNTVCGGAAPGAGRDGGQTGVSEAGGLYTGVTAPPEAVQRIDDLYHLYGPDSPPPAWTYLPDHPVPDRAALHERVRVQQQSADPYYFAIIDNATQRLVGTLSLMRAEPCHRVVEVGHILYGPSLQKSRMATEAQYLLMHHVFDALQYRRYEWKCDSLNAPSRQAAQRLGFRFEGILRNAIVYKGRSRDTAWYSMLPEEWQAMKPALQAWLHPDNFDAQGRQIRPLQTLARPATA